MDKFFLQLLVVPGNGNCYFKLNAVFLWILRYLMRGICVTMPVQKLKMPYAKVTSSLDAVTVVTVVLAI